MPNLPPPGTALLTVSWDTVVGEEWSHSGDPDDGPEVQPVTIGDQVILALVNRLLEDVRREVKVTIKEHLADAIRDQVNGIVAETLTGDIRMTNAWGEPIGEPTTLRTMIAKQASEFITAKPVRDIYNDRNKTPTFADLLKVEVTDAMKTDLQDAIIAARKQVAVAVQERAGQLLGEVINTTAPRR